MSTITTTVTTWTYFKYKFLTYCQDETRSWLSAQLSDQVLRSLIPAVPICCSVARDLAALLPLSKPLTDTLRALCSPFKNFIALEDLTDHVTVRDEPRHFKSKTLSLSSLAFIAAAGWLGRFVYGLHLEQADCAFTALIASLAWVSHNYSFPQLCPEL